MNNGRRQKQRNCIVCFSNRIASGKSKGTYVTYRTRTVVTYKFPELYVDPVRYQNHHPVESYKRKNKNFNFKTVKIIPTFVCSFSEVFIFSVILSTLGPCRPRPTIKSFAFQKMSFLQFVRCPFRLLIVSDRARQTQFHTLVLHTGLVDSRVSTQTHTHMITIVL